MIGRWLQKRIFRRQLAANMKTLNTSPLGQVRPVVLINDAGDRSLCIECVPCQSEMYWGDSPEGWTCESCGFYIDYRQTHSMFLEVRGMIDRMVGFLEERTLSTNRNNPKE